MPNIYLNGQTQMISPNLSLEEVVAQFADQDNPVAIALNRCFIPRSQYANTFLQEEDEIEIVSPMQGG